MGGEKNKRSGEIGEKLADAYLELIGWNKNLKAIDVACSDNKHFGTGGNPRVTHGGDRVYIYNNPFYDDRTDVVLVSVKNNLNGYSEKETELKSNLKAYLQDINELISCAKHDVTLKGIYLQSFQQRKHLEFSGLIIWTSSESKDCHRNILQCVSNLRSIPEKCSANVFFVDGGRIDFTLKALTHAKSLLNTTWEFLYPETGLINRQDERHGDYLPLELIIADVIPLKISSGKEETLYLYVNQNFETDCYKRMLSLALSFAGAWTKEIKIGFPDFNIAHHENEAISAEFPFHDRKKKFSAFCFTLSILNSLEE